MKPSIFLWLCVGAWALSQVPAFAAETVDVRLQRCLDDPDKASTGDQDECIAQAEREWDGLLNEDYKRLGDRLSPDGRARLRDAQRAWLRSRDADRALIGAVYATTRGTMYAPMNADAVMELTAQRARRLHSYLSVLDGVAMPLPAQPAFDDPAQNGVRLPQRGSHAAKHCPTATDACVDRLTPLYLQDLAEIETAMKRRLPRTARPLYDASDRAWTVFRDRELALIDVLTPAPVPVLKLGLPVERLGLLDGTVGVIGVE
ncbi:MAG TPA: lysozyme inhibitor LprI family protein [Aliidongia sp.]|uniref:lysozyme inhibitor LprI family protein n=1 Tax=Aliidongia sp. TaxID=1914230 RepID=UPI002DDCBBD8|nr:lysozyme inhibitor LprI family protein [Aliidongia sp.]HEV2675370.1 lysozyme inhibitor LprI family protein [Aliidongia sp.]